MMRSALSSLEAHSETTVVVGDRMDTEIISGLEAGLRTILVLTRSTQGTSVLRFPYRPTKVVESIADLVDMVARARGAGRTAVGRRAGPRPPDVVTSGPSARSSPGRRGSCS
jgi:hypothetical protein